MTVKIVEGLCVAAAAALFLAGPAAAQDRKFRPGEIVAQGGGKFVRVVQCAPKDGRIQCEVHGWENGRASGAATWKDAEALARAEAAAGSQLPLKQ
jgi:hypothetical protein